ncbi:transposase [Allorhizocola rhizosphaerae]|uniref:transposase n=1 Tax=Allorhizocola rhizosphaerae TaxID=1872709 RepID=UPI00319E639E
MRTLDRRLATIRAGGGQQPLPPPLPSTRQITGWIMRADSKPNDGDRLALKDALTRCLDLATLADLAQGFTDLVRQRCGQHLVQWIETAQQAPFPQIDGFAAGLLNDLDAVTAGLTQPWSSDAVEGNVNRIKMLKRQMFGGQNSTCYASESCSPKHPHWTINESVPEPDLSRR